MEKIVMFFYTNGHRYRAFVNVAEDGQTITDVNRLSVYSGLRKSGLGNRSPAYIRIEDSHPDYPELNDYILNEVPVE